MRPRFNTAERAAADRGIADADHAEANHRYFVEAARKRDQSGVCGLYHCARNCSILRRHLQADVRFAGAKKWALLGTWQ